MRVYIDALGLISGVSFSPAKAGDILYVVFHQALPGSTKSISGFRTAYRTATTSLG